MNLYYKSNKKYRTVTTIDINLHQSSGKIT